MSNEYHKLAIGGGKNRYNSIDVAKGIGILLVVLGHSVSHSLFPIQVIYSFHMPLFFILAGMFIHPSGKKYSDIVKKKTRSLVFPLINFTIILSLLDLIKGKPFLLLNCELPSPLWFLLSLYICSTVCPLLYRRGKIVVIITILLSGFLGIVAFNTGINNNLPFHISSIPYSTMWLSIGFYLRKLPCRLLLIKSWQLAILVVLLLSALLLLVRINNVHTATNLGIMEPFLPGYLCGLSGSFCILLFSELISRISRINTPFIFLGQNSLSIMCTHMIFIYLYYTLIRDFITVDSIHKITQLLFTIICSSIAAIVINNYFPALIGKTK